MDDSREPTLNPAWRRAIARLGYDEVPEVVTATLNVVRRGHHLALAVGRGSGKEIVYALAAAMAQAQSTRDLIANDTALRTLILTPTREEAAELARALNELGSGVEATDGQADEGGGEAHFTCVVWPAGGNGRGDAPEALPAGAMALAGQPGRILPEVRAGRLGLAGVRLLVVDGVGGLEATGQWAAVEAMLDTLDSDAVKVVCAEEVNERLEDLLVRQLPRARRWPPELFGASETPPVRKPEAKRPGRPKKAPAAPGLLFALGVGLEERLDRLAAALRQLGADPGGEATVVRCLGPEAATQVAAAMAARGLQPSTARGSHSGVRVAWGEADVAPDETVILFGLPAGLPTLLAWLSRAKHRAAVVPAAHFVQLRLLARRAGWELKPMRQEVVGPDMDAVDQFRALVRAELESGDLGAELLLLEPLLEEHGASRVAAAVTSLLRSRPREGVPSKPWADVEAASGMPLRPLVPPASVDRGTRPAWTRIFINSGKRDGVTPGDIVGAITGETSAAAAQIGKIEIKGSFALVDIDSQVADAVIRRLNGASIKGRVLSVRLDREG